MSWHATDDILLYYTWSQGFRPGGFNRGSTRLNRIQAYVPRRTQPAPPGAYQCATPSTYSPDTLINNEIGFKTEWFAHRLQLNGAVYQEDWKNTIVEFFDPQQGFGNLTFSTNGPNYRVRGVELQVVARVMDQLTVTSSGSYNRSTQQNSPYLINNNPASPNLGKPITQFANVLACRARPLAQSPLYQVNTRIRYEFPLGDYKAFTQVGGQYNASVWSNVGRSTTITSRRSPPSTRPPASPRISGTCRPSRKILRTGMPAPTPTTAQFVQTADGAASADRRRDVWL